MSDTKTQTSAGLWLGPADAAHAETGDPLVCWKDMLNLGKYVDPKSGQPFEVTEAMYADLEASFGAMRKIGDEPPLLAWHADPKDAQKHTPRELLDKTLGYVIDLRRNGTKLQGKVRFADEDAKRLGIKHKVSVRTVPNVQLSDGSVHPYALTHLALTNRPVLTKGIDDWSLALSRDGEGATPDTYFAAPTPYKESTMTPDQLAKVQKIVPTATADNAVDLLLSYVATETKNGEKTSLELSQVKAERDGLLKNKPLELSNSDLLYGKRAIEGDVKEATRKWPQVARDAAIAYATGKTRLGLMLSRDGERLGADDFVDFCKSIPLKGLAGAAGEQTGVQGMTLARDVPDGQKDANADALAEGRILAESYQAKQLASRGLK